MENKTILVIDDETAICDLVKALLEPDGFCVFTAHNGEEGLTLLKKMIPDLIILDMNMPKMNGISFYSQIASQKDSTPTIPVLVMTGRGEMQSFFEGLNVNGFLTKPFRAVELIETVKRIINEKAKPDNVPTA